LCSGETLTDKPKICYTQGNHDVLDQIKLLWIDLNQYHCQRSLNFKDHYNDMTFEKRRAYLIKKAQRGVLHVDLAFDKATGETVGYLVSSVVEKTGEIESVFVHAKYRHMGVGGSLMQNALAWMEQQGATSKIVEVSVGNEGAFGFYGRFGFLPRKTVLQQPEKST